MGAMQRGPAQNNLQQLCESWWEKLANSSKGEQHYFAEHFLTLLGWEDPVPIAMQALTPRLSPVSYIVRGGGQTALVAHFVMPGVIEVPSNLCERGLDFSESTRMLVNAGQKLHVRYAFITDLYRSYLYDTSTEELLLYADSPEMFRKEFSDVLTRAGVEAGALEEVRRQPRSYVARQLRDWGAHWMKTLGQKLLVPDEESAVLLDRLIILRYLVEFDFLKRGNWSLQRRFQALLERASAPSGDGCGKSLLSLFHDMHVGWTAEIFAPLPHVDAALERDDLASAILRELSCIGGHKFALLTVLEMFNYGDAQEKARVRMIPEQDEERTAFLAKQTLETVDEACLDIVLDDEGYRAMLHWYDQLLALYYRLEREWQGAVRKEAPTREDLDLFEWSERDAAKPVALKDKFHYAAEHGLAIYYSSPRQYRTARLLLYLHIISRYHQSKARFTHFPALEAAFQERPKYGDIKQRKLGTSFQQAVS